MENNKFANIANYKNNSDKTSESRTNGMCKLKKAVATLVEGLNIKNGSFTIYVHNGKPGLRIEIQNKVFTEL